MWHDCWPARRTPSLPGKTSGTTAALAPKRVSKPSGPPDGSKLSFGAVLTTSVAAKRVSVQSTCLYWQQNKFRSRGGLIRTYESPSYDKSRTQKTTSFLVKTRSNSTSLPCGNDFTAPKLVSLPTGPSQLLRNSFFNQKGRPSTPQSGSHPSRAPGNKAAALRKRAILITTRTSVKRASRSHSLTARSNKSTKRG